MTWAFQALTGDPVMQMVLRPSGQWERLDIRHNKTSDNKRSVGLYASGEKHDSGDMFFLVRKYVKAGALMGASIDSDGENKDDNKGLVAGHAYSVLDARSFQHNGGRVNLLNLRNPWGTFEWKGAWSDNSAEWGKHPQIKSLIKPVDKDDGAFWIEWGDFCKVFCRIDFCNRSTGLRDLSLDTMEADGACANCLGPCKGCAVGCGQYWFCCKGCKALYCDHKTQDQTMALDDKGRDDDLLTQIGIKGGKGAPENEDLDR